MIADNGPVRLCSCVQRRAVQVMLVGVLDLDADDVALRQMARVAQMDFAVDLRRIGL